MYLLSSRVLVAATFAPMMKVEGSCSWGDYNNDGCSDLFGGGTYWTNNYANDPNTPFIAHAGALPGIGFGSSLGDYNNDGFIDVFGWQGKDSDGSGRPILYTNKAGIEFIDDSVKFLPLTGGAIGAGISRSSTWVDLTGDGYLDVYVSSWVKWWRDSHGPAGRALIYTSNADETFTHTWTGPAAYGKGVAACDFNRDGRQDLYVSNYWMGKDFLWRNDGFDGTNPNKLTDVALDYGVNDGPGHTQGSSFGDFDNDGEIDLFVSNFAHPKNPELRFMKNQGKAGGYHFIDKGKCGIAQQEPQNSGVPADFDNDGYLDLIITVDGGYGPTPQWRLYRNNGDWTFTDVTSQIGLDDTSQNFVAAWGDYDNDGFLDLVAGGRLWHNPGLANWPNNNYLKLALHGGRGKNALVNRSAIGAQVRIDVPGRGTLTRQVEASTGMCMQNDLTLHFGLGNYDQPVDVTIFWPDGTTQVLTGLAINKFWAITILDPLPEQVVPKPAPSPAAH